ncbi:uncharacterized protein G2W53_024862 [Senna tora]|uniref:Uncharacterized protein n=1 Tax=Senna tora TaxID=362788 RepID=A0A834TEA3_9FABA|nr:uncharacterized protein G2W53_024862 [Senna tora]
MGLTNFVLTVAGVSAVILLLRSDVKQSASIFKRNVKHIRQWLEEETANSSKCVPVFGIIGAANYCLLDDTVYWKCHVKFTLKTCIVLLLHLLAIEKSAKELESKVSPKDIPKKEKD